MWQRREFMRAAVVSTGVAAAGGLLTENASAAARARVVSEKKLDARTRDLTIYSPAMGRNMKVRVLLPRGWSRRRTWPVLWLLHGGTSDYTAWSRNSPIKQMTAHRKVIVVMPEGGPGGGYTNWLVGPQWETFHLVELRVILEQRYKANKRRAVAGLSAGGYGALIYAARHPRAFKFAACFSGYGSTLQPGAPEVLLTGIPGSGAEKFLMWGQPQVNKATWQAHDPLYRAAGLRGTGLYISCARNGVKGPLDPKTAQAVDPAEAFVYYTTKPLIAKLRKLGIPVTTHIYARGTHSWVYFVHEFKRSWPLITKALNI
ncbi:MAG: alpha/beta hydrolase family protein [Streptosporangiaceae bacterium]